MSPADEARLHEAARAARGHAVCTYSGFAVGAALLTESGAVVSGCNVENATYGLTVCAERVALFKALSEGVRGFRAVCVVTAAARPTAPCGACRQLLWEFGGDLEVLLADLSGVRARTTLAALFPAPFDATDLSVPPP